jgi:microcystin-dependent protein
MKNKFLAPALFSAFLVSALPLSAYALDGALCDKDAYPSLAGQVQCLKDKLSAVMDKIGSTTPSASTTDLAQVRQQVEQLATKQNVISDKQNVMETKQNAMETKQNSVVSSQTDLAAKLDASTANLQTSLEAQTAELKKYVDNIPPPANVPVGTVVDWAGGGKDSFVLPKGWLLCDGRALKISEHPKLYAAVKQLYLNNSPDDIYHYNRANLDRKDYFALPFYEKHPDYSDVVYLPAQAVTMSEEYDILPDLLSNGDFDSNRDILLKIIKDD